MHYNLPKNFTEQQQQILQQITAEELNELAQQYLPYNNMNIVVVGDGKVVLEPLKALGYDVVEVTNLV